MDSISPELIKKYLDGLCTTEEEQMILEWYNSFDQKDDPYKQLSALQKEQLRKRMLLKIMTDIHIAPAKRRGINSKILIYATIASAALIIIILNISGIFSKTGTTRNEITDADEQVLIRNKSQVIAKQVLPDNSIAWLSPGATLTYHKLFKKQLREVRLSGESFFEVTKDHTHPFVIYSPHIVTRVWGTSFRVHDNAGKENAEVAVITGKVSVTAINKTATNIDLARDKGVMLLPKQKVSYGFSGQLKVAQLETNSSANMWNKTDLTFDNMPLRDAIKVLNKQFKVNIVLADETLADSKIQADFNDQSFPDIMQILTKLLHMTYITNGEKFELLGISPNQPVTN